MTVLSLVSTSNASFVFPFKVNESESTTLNGNVGDQERVVVSLNYEIKVSQKREEVWGETPIKHFSTTNETDYNNFFTTIKNYNFNRGKKFSPFIGVGVGIASCKVVQGYYGNDAVKAIFTPRIGIEMFNHFRVTAYSKLGYRGYNNFGISVGYAFGGGRK